MQIPCWSSHEIFNLTTHLKLMSTDVRVPINNPCNRGCINTPLSCISHKQKLTLDSNSSIPKFTTKLDIALVFIS